MLRLMTACAAFAVLAAPALAEEMRLVTGQVFYPQRIALPPTAKLVISVEGPYGVILAAEEIEVAGASVPFAFDFELPQAASGLAHFAFVLESGETFFSALPISIAAGADPLLLGEVLLSQGQITQAQYSCAQGRYQAVFLGEGLSLTDPSGQERQLRQEISANGARYVEEESGFEFWVTGENARLTQVGEEPIECSVQSAPSYRAGGFEPSWGIEITADTFVFGTASGAPPVSGKILGAPVWQEGAVVWTLGEAFTLTSQPQICRDEATGMPHPYTATLAEGATLYQGCGGEPMDLLLGAEWQIEALQGEEVPAEGTLGFAADGSLAGRAFCNRYNVAFSLTGESLTFAPGISTMMACPEPLMDLERRLHQALEEVRRFDIASDGALQLLTSEGEVLVSARR